MVVRKHLLGSCPPEVDTKHFRICIWADEEFPQIQGFVSLFKQFIQTGEGRAILDYFGIKHIIEIDANDDRDGQEVVPITFDIEGISDETAREFLRVFVPEFQKSLEEDGVHVIGCNGYFEVCVLMTDNDKGLGTTWDDFIKR